MEYDQVEWTDFDIPESKWNHNKIGISCKVPVWDGRHYFVSIAVVPPGHKKIQYYWVIECLYCPFDIPTSEYSDGMFVMRPRQELDIPVLAKKDHYLCAVWKSNIKKIHCMIEPPEKMGETLQKELRIITGNDKADISNLPWNSVPRNSLALLGPLCKRIDELEFEQEHKKHRLTRAFKKIEIEQHWTNLKR